MGLCSHPTPPTVGEERLGPLTRRPSHPARGWGAAGVQQMLEGEVTGLSYRERQTAVLHQPVCLSVCLSFHISIVTSNLSCRCLWLERHVETEPFSTRDHGYEHHEVSGGTSALCAGVHTLTCFHTLVLST